ncbi:oxidative damage protection protein [Candidatus Tremblaya phenacola]|uniref:Putative Fe(2+)-trafficking protein n=1 Tax=Candidatus Tremblayella phenacoccinincola TaxID=1010676 RepID=A0A2G0V762_9PROT|nr:oxidative damage protection protein [Candidatus Tremblaya phenacola]PHN16310.1 putative Fe(2+)-trafficking protein [Candidatus Tremblaya phenacola]
MYKRSVFCVKVGSMLDGFDMPPFTNKLGVKIYKNVSKKAWNDWLRKQTTLINEYRLNLSNPNVRWFLYGQLSDYLFKNTVYLGTFSRIATS